MILVERDREIARVEAALDGACRGAGATLLVEGPAGMGKTSILASARELAAARGMRVLHARGTPLEADYAMGIARQALEPVIREAIDVDSLFAGAAGLARSVVVDAPEATDAAPPAVLHGLHWLMANLAERAPVLLAIDDAQWADEPSLRFLAYLARRVESCSVSLLIAARDLDHDGGVAQLLGELRADPATRQLHLRPLGVEGVGTLLGDLTDGPVEEAFSRACRDASGGNPFLLTELVRELRDQGIPFTGAETTRVSGFAPPVVARRVRHDLARLGADARGLAHAVAVLGDDVALDVAAQLAELSTRSATAAAGHLARAGILGSGLPLRFAHPLLAAATRADLPEAELAAAHGRAAELMRARGAGPERVALHLLHVPPTNDPGLVAELRTAADRARRRGAPATSAALLTRALAEPPAAPERPDVLLELGNDEFAAGRTELAAEHLELAFRSATDHTLRGRALLGLFQARAGRFAEQRALEALFEDAVPEALQHDRELGLRLWAVKLLVIEPGPRWIEAARGVTDLSIDTPGEAIIAGHAALPIVNRGTSGPALAAVVERAALQADPLLEEGATSLVMTGIVLGLLWADRLETARDVLERAIAVARRRGAAADFSVALHFRALVNLRSGRLRDAEADALSSLAAASGNAWGGAGHGALSPLLASLIDQGRIDDAARELVARGQTDAIVDSPAANALLVHRARLRAAQGAARGARADWDEARRRIDRHFSGIDPSWVPMMLDMAVAFHSLGELQRRDALLDEATDLAIHWALPGYVGQARHVKARLQRGDDAPTVLAAAIELLRQSPARLELARALVSLGEALRRRGRRSDSRAPLREGYDLARACGADALAETARIELRASGVRLRREALTGAAALTASERRIAEMAADGATNAEIAQALFLTVKTVEGHLTSAYRKLDIGRRADLIHALAAKTPGSGPGSSP